MLPSAPVHPYERLLTASLAVTCAAMASAIVMIASLLLPGTGSPFAGVRTGESVSVFSDAAAPRSAGGPAGRAAALAALPPDPDAGFSSESVALAAAVDAPAEQSAGVPVFSDDAEPETPVDPDQQSVELGLRFSPKVDGTVSGIRFYRTTENVGPHVGTVWGPAGEVLARVAFADDTAVGWQTAAIEPAVAVTAGTAYTVSYLAPTGRYAADEYYFDAGVETDALSIPAGAGVYAYGSGTYPTEVYRDSNYYVDVVFRRAAVATPEPTATPDPTVAPEPSPTGTATPAPEPTAEPTATPDPTAIPEPTAPPAGEPDAGVFGDAVTPELDNDPDRASVELGMRFVPKVDGEITALRFYRSAENPAPHTGTLWSPEGERLASVDFGTPTEGWQTAELDAPVRVEPGTEYVVSYLARGGRYAADEHYFDVGIENEYFSVPAGAGVYVYGAGGFPTETYRNSNYYVDVRFSPYVGATPESTLTTSPAPTSEPTATPTAEPSPTATPTDVPRPQPTTGGPDVLDLPTEAWWGGPEYYAAWDKAARAGWTDESFFPIAVFFGKPAHARQLAEIGVNTYMGAEHDGSPVSQITGAGVSLLAQGEWTSAEVGDDPRVVGWHVSDECDMGGSGCDSAEGQYGSLRIQQGYVADLRAKNDGRFLQANFGNGVLGSYWSNETMDDHLALVDMSSVDKYAYTSPHVQDLFRGSPSWPDGRDPASAGAYGWQQDRMETFMSPVAAKPNWIFVETARPFLIEDGATTISVDQIRGAVWNGIIHGAAGISYFQHNNDGRCGTYSLLECGQALRDGVGAINAQVQEFAPVINTPSYEWSFGAGLETALKAHDGSAYVFAMTDGTSGTRTFTLPSGLGATVEVVGEDREIPVVDGVFTDAFAAESTVHIYKVAIE